MKKFITLSQIERKNLIQKAAFDLGMRFDVVEKDIWVCYVLGKLFSLKELHGKLVFKGGTCLSKAYGLIERFSEDVDLTISKSCLNVEGSSNKPRKVESRIRHAAEDFVKDEIYELLNKAFAKDLEDGSWSLNFSEEDQSTLLFQFPRAENIVLWDTFKWDSSHWSDETGSYNYIKPSLKLEFGTLGDVSPSEEKTVEPYAKKILPDFFDQSQVKVLDVKRNFLEKLLILHSICLRPIDKPLKHHYSRHYYDVFCLIKSGIAKEALKFPEILESVKENKITFWDETKPYKNINSFYDLKVVPSQDSRLKELESDYERMKEMFFGKYPNFLDVIAELRSFEKSLTI
jgi:predicted nucleotidyltransferase component of viral defense system